MRLPAEWEEQSFIQLTWPHKEGDWADKFEEAEACFVEIAKQISATQKLVVISNEDITKTLKERGCNIKNVFIIAIESNDTWARDHAAITTIDKKGKAVINDFIFNGWGLKFPANKDNLITLAMFESDAFPEAKYKARSFMLEGGAIESDGCGVIMTTESCMLSPNRNLGFKKPKIEKKLEKFLGAKKILWLSKGRLEGDDTDGHIDTLARFASADTIVYQACDDQNDSHYEILNEMKEELEGFRQLNGKPYHLIALPWPKAKYAGDGHRLPATYANFLIINKAVLVPTYNDASDEKAIEILRGVFMGRDVIGIDCSVLIQEHGSLHCVTMQYPKEVGKC